ncbi:MAG: RdgB/HAM1 family non-canonical purine NTP pyrophosphatase [Myxococcota bacterium]
MSPRALRLLLATRNTGKLRELRLLLEPQGIEVESLATHPEVGAIEETGDSFEANARLKASLAARASGLWSLGEDSGLEVDALEGAPGVRSARFSGVHGDDTANTRTLLERLAGERHRAARYVCVMALAQPDGRVVEVAHGACEGEILEAPRGRGGFGYDPCFRPSGEERSMAELAPSEKAARSHRGRAARALLPGLIERLSSTV